MGNLNLVSYETIIRATSGEPEAVDEVLRHYSKSEAESPPLKTGILTEIPRTV